jgi:hypothetical protein
MIHLNHYFILVLFLASQLNTEKKHRDNNLFITRLTD